jgi:hypothetical protein
MLRQTRGISVPTLIFAVLLVIPLLGLHFAPWEDVSLEIPRKGGCSEEVYGSRTSRTSGVTLSLDSDRYNSTSDPESDRNVTITGSVTCQTGSVTLTEVTIEASSELGWELALEEDEFSFGPSGGQEDVLITLTIPPATPAFTRDDITLSGQASEPPGGAPQDLEPADCRVHVDQYYRISSLLEGSGETLSAREGEEVVLNASVINGGNGPDTLEVALSEESSLEGKGWAIGFSQEACLLEPDERWELTLTVQVPDGAAGFIPLTVNFNSSGPDPVTGGRVNSSHVVWLRVTALDGTGGGGAGGTDGEGGDGEGGADGEDKNDDDAAEQFQESLRWAVGGALLLLLLAALAAYLFSARGGRGRWGEGAEVHEMEHEE